MGPHEYPTTDGRTIKLQARGMAAIEAAAQGADLYAATPEGYQLVAADRRDWVIRRAKNKRSRVLVEQFATAQ